MIKIIFFSDSHLGIGLTQKSGNQGDERVEDFFTNYNYILSFAEEQKADMVIHGGDLFNRSNPPPDIIDRAYRPLLNIAASGIPVLIVPGNHERSFLPATLFDTHPNLLRFDYPRTYNFFINKSKLSFSGFPFYRGDIRSEFPGFLEKTGWRNHTADFRFLCFHQAVEGAKVGVQNYTFRYGEEVIKITDIPAQFNAALAGHIHRAQILESPHEENASAVHVVYPGAIERTSFAEREEQKGFYVIEINNGKVKFLFKELPSRNMVTIDLRGLEIINGIVESARPFFNNCAEGDLVTIKIPYEIRKKVFAQLTKQNLDKWLPDNTVYNISVTKER